MQMEDSMILNLQNCLQVRTLEERFDTGCFKLRPEDIKKLSEKKRAEKWGTGE